MFSDYLDFARDNPNLFRQSNFYPITLDEHKLSSYSGRVGIVYDNSPYFKVVADLIDVPRSFTYARVIYPKGGTVIIPRLNREYLGVIYKFRHAIREVSGPEFPRGFNELNLHNFQNAKKELQEELGIPESAVTSVTLLGSTYIDAGLTNAEPSYVLLDITDPGIQSLGHEGITKVSWVRQSDLESMELKDNLTISALYLLKRSGM